MAAPFALDRSAAKTTKRFWSARWTPYAGIALAGGCLAWLSGAHPGAMPVWAPWDFSPVEFFSISLAFLWFLRGLATESARPRPETWRAVSFVAGLGVIYLVLQTRFDYWAQHLFLLNRVQHVVMHHLGPFLLALAGAGDTLRRGMPSWVRRAAESRPVSAISSVLQRPWIAGVLFAGSFFFWLIPPIHFRAMLDARLYQLMNWTMVVDGILFWSLALDSRPKPPARISFGARIGLILGVMIPQVVLGALLTVWPRSLYPSYDLCGRMLPSMSALTDQHLGGAIVWIPPGILSMAGLLRLIIALSRQRSTACS